MTIEERIEQYLNHNCMRRWWGREFASCEGPFKRWGDKAR